MSEGTFIIPEFLSPHNETRRFVSPNHTQTMMGKALHAACVSSRTNDRFQESFYLLLELLRAGVVHGGRWGGPDAEPLSGGPSFGSEEDQSSTLLIMRVMSILPLNFRVSLGVFAPGMANYFGVHSTSSGWARFHESYWSSTLSSERSRNPCDIYTRRYPCTSCFLAMLGGIATTVRISCSVGTHDGSRGHFAN